MTNFTSEEVLKQIRLANLRANYGILGNIYIVIGASETWLTSATKAFNQSYSDGSQVIHNTLASAYAATVSNRNDLILLDASTEHAITAMLDISKNRVNFLGVSPGNRHYGQRARIALGVTAVATDIATIRNTGVGNSFINLKISNNNSKAESLYTFADGGEYTYMKNVELYLSTQLAVAGASELLANGDSSKYEDCTVGSNANEVTANGARPCVLLTSETITGKVARDVTFQNCFFWRKAGDVDNSFVHSSGANDIERMCLFDNCLFNNTKLASQTMTVGISATSALARGEIILRNCTVYNVTDFATQTGIWNASGAAHAANGGEVIQAA